MKSDVDLIICWPVSVDYPLWREFIKVHRQFFNKVIVVFTKTNQGFNYESFVQDSMKDEDITFLSSRELKANEDWRNVAVNEALELSSSNWIWFTEQDLFVIHTAFWPMIARFMLEFDAIGYQDGATRLHPSNLWVKREWIEKTGKDFGIVPNVKDHFARFFTSLRLSGAKIKKLDDPSPYFYHMNGLSHNWSLLERNEEITYKPDEFKGYLELCLKQDNLDPRFKEIAERGVKSNV